MLVNTVLKRQLAEGSNHILNGGVLPVAVLAAKGVKPWDAVEEIVDNGDNDGDTNGVCPDDDNCDNVDPSVLTELAVVGLGVCLVVGSGHPAEDGEDGCESVDTENGDDQLERGESLATTSNEDEPILSERNLEKEDGLDSTEVGDDTTVGQEESTTNDPCTESEQETKNDGDEPDLGQLPFDGARVRVSVVVGNGNGSQISEESKEDNELSADSLVQDDHRSDKVDLEMQTERNTVLDVGLHTLENLTGSLDGQDNGGQTRGKEHDISGSLGSLSRTLDSNTTVRLLERRGVIDTVSSHSSQVTTLLQHLYDLVFVFGEDFGETVGALDEVVLGSAGETAVDELGRVVDLGTECKHLASLLRDGDSVTTVCC